MFVDCYWNTTELINGNYIAGDFQEHKLWIKDSQRPIKCRFDQFTIFLFRAGKMRIYDILFSSISENPFSDYEQPFSNRIHIGINCYMEFWGFILKFIFKWLTSFMSKCDMEIKLIYFAIKLRTQRGFLEAMFGGVILNKNKHFAFCWENISHLSKHKWINENNFYWKLKCLKTEAISVCIYIQQGKKKKS